MAKQMLIKNSKRIMLGLAAITLVMAVVCSVLINFGVEIKEELPKMQVTVLDISDYSTNESKQEGLEKGETTQTTKVVGQEGKKLSAKAETNDQIYINQDNTVVLQLDGTDETKYKADSLTQEKIHVQVNGTEVTPTTKTLSSASSITNGVRYELTLGGIPGNGQLSVVVDADSLEDQASNTNEQTVQVLTSFDKPIIIDNTKPTISFAPNGNTTYAKTQSTTVTVSDSLDSASGVLASSLKYQWTQSITEPAENTFVDTFTSGATLSKDEVTGNNWYLWILAKDNVGNTKIERSNEFYIDNQGPSAPTVTAKLGGSTGTAYTPGTWTNQNVYVELSSTDDNLAIKQYEWYEENAWTTRDLTTSASKGTITYSTDLDTTLRFRALDDLNNPSQESTLEIKRDTVKPTIEAVTSSQYGSYVSITLNDNASGVNGWQITNSNTEPTTGWKNIATITNTTVIANVADGLTVGNKYIWVKDQAGNTKSKEITVYYNVTYNKETNVSEIGKTEENNSTGTITLPTITPATGYHVLGWYNGDTKFGDPGESKSITDNMTLTAKVEENAVVVNINKDGAAWSASGIKITLYSGTEPTSFTQTVSESGVSRASFTAVPVGTYRVYAGKNSSEKTELIDTTIDLNVSGNDQVEGTLNYYSLTTLAGAGVGTVSDGGQYLYLPNGTQQDIAINATIMNGYNWNTWTKTEGTTPATFTPSTQSQNIKLAAGAVTLRADATYTATPIISRTDYNTFTVSATEGSQYFISTSQTTKPSATLEGWSTTSSQDVSTTTKQTWYVWVKDAQGNVSENSATITNYKVTLAQGAGTTLSAKADSTSGTNVGTNTYVLSGTPIYPIGILNDGYNGLVIKKGETIIINGSSQEIIEDTTFTTSSTYIATPTISRSDYNTFTVSATDGSQYFISTSQTTKPLATLEGWSTTSSQDVSTTEKQTWYVWVKDAQGNVSDNNATITNYKIVLTAGTGTTLSAKADTTSGTNVDNNTYVLSQTPVYPTGQLNDGYRTLVLKNGETIITNGSSQEITEDTTFTTSATANKVIVTIKKDGSDWYQSGIRLYISRLNYVWEVTANTENSATAVLSPIPNGTWSLKAGKSDIQKSQTASTGIGVTINDNDATATVNYYSLTLEKGTGISDVKSDYFDTPGTIAYMSNYNIPIDAEVANGYTWSTWSKKTGTDLTTFTPSTKNQSIKMGEGPVTLTANAVDSTAPVINISPESTTECKSKSVTISIDESGTGLANTNTYEYYLSTSSTALEGGKWMTYTNGTPFTLGDDETTSGGPVTGTTYLFVKRVSDNSSNISTSGGTLTTIGSDVYQRFGSYVFDNTGPTVSSLEVTSPSTGMYKAGEVITIDAVWDENIYGTDIAEAITASTAPELTFTFGNKDSTRTATFSSVNGTTISYTYTIQSGDNGPLVISDYTGTAYDVSGNSGTASKKDNTGNIITADTVAPTYNGLLYAHYTIPTGAVNALNMYQNYAGVIWNVCVSVTENNFTSYCLSTTSTEGSYTDATLSNGQLTVANVSYNTNYYLFLKDAAGNVTTVPNFKINGVAISESSSGSGSDEKVTYILYETLQKAFGTGTSSSAHENGSITGNITLLKDISNEKPLNKRTDKTMIVSMAGKTIDSAGVYASTGMYCSIANEGKLELKGTSSNKGTIGSAQSQHGGIYNKGTLTMTHMTVSGNGGNSHAIFALQGEVTLNSCYVFAVQCDSISMKTGTLTVRSTEIGTSADYANIQTETADITINGTSELISGNGGKSIVALGGSSTANITIQDTTTITSNTTTTTNSGSLIDVGAGYTLTVQGSAAITSSGSYAIRKTGNGNLYIKGGTITATNGSGVRVDDASVLNMSGGTIKHQTNSATNSAIYHTSTESMTITGGDVISELGYVIRAACNQKSTSLVLGNSSYGYSTTNPRLISNKESGVWLTGYSSTYKLNITMYCGRMYYKAGNISSTSVNITPRSGYSVKDSTGTISVTAGGKTYTGMYYKFLGT